MSDELWAPSINSIASTQMAQFTAYVNSHYDLSLSHYDSLYEWSISYLEDFWGSLSSFAKIKYSTPHKTVLKNHMMPGAIWFDGATLNFAENLLRFRDDRRALTFVQDGGEKSESISYNKLYSLVAKTASFFKECGLVPGDRVAAFMPNRIETVIAMLATTSLGAVWSSCSPDFGFNGVIQRFSQIEPKVLLTADGYYYGGKAIDSLDKVQKVCEEVTSIEKIIIVPYLNSNPQLKGLKDPILWQEIETRTDEEIDFCQVPFSHPLYIMYSSGTTGIPKCMVHSVGGTLLQHIKELMLHCDLKRDDTIFYYTTCGWMMWNWLVSSLYTGADIILYDGNPFWPDPNVLWRMGEKHKISIFGTSAKFISICMNKNLHPGKNHDLSPLRTLLSTGSPLSADSFRWIYQEVKKELHLASICGGTDIISCFILGDPTSPVYPGEIQKRGLGMKVEAWSPEGTSLTEEKGELVCCAPFPSMPISFWNDPDNKKYLSAYFDVFPGIWRHGDYIEITKKNGIIVHGRSDATLNPGGVRLGTADLYQVVEALEEIDDSLAVAQSWKNDVRIILFVVMQGEMVLDEAMSQKISNTIKTNLSPHHVPAKILAIPAIPVTINGKKVELAVTNIIHGKAVKNKDSLANPEVLAGFENISEIQR